MTKIRAYAVHKAGSKLEPFEYALGLLEDNDVEIDIKFCGICHSDLSMLQNEWDMTTYPFVPGHEIIGQISAVGKHVTHLKIGEWVGLGWHSNYCHICDCCLAGDHNLCAEAKGTIVGRHGGFADKIRANAISVIKLPETIDKKSAGPLLCGGITVFNPLVQCDIKPTQKVAVIGIGGLGHLALQFYKAWGCEVTAFTSNKNKEQELFDLGASRIIDSRNAKEIESMAGQFDFIISTVNVNLDWNIYINTLKPKGRLHLVGVVTEPLQLQLFPMLAGQRTLSSSPVGSPATIRKMLEFADRHNIRAITEIYPLNKVNDAMERLKSNQARYRLVLQM